MGSIVLGDGVRVLGPSVCWCGSMRACTEVFDGGGSAAVCVRMSAALVTASCQLAPFAGTAIFGGYEEESTLQA